MKQKTSQAPKARHPRRCRFETTQKNFGNALRTEDDEQTGVMAASFVLTAREQEFRAANC
jgi:hypothetical protein